MNRIDRKIPLCWRIAPALAAAAALSCFDGAARADTSGIAINRFEPSERGSDWFANSSLDFRGKARPAIGAVYDWGYRSFVFHGVNGGGDVNVLTDQMFVHIGGSIVLGDNVRLAMNLPVTLYENGDDLTSVARAGRPSPATSYPGVGDLRLSVDARVLGEYGDAFIGALGVQVFVPTGSRDALTSDGTMRFLPHFMVAGEGDGFMYAASIGIHYRPQDEVLLGRAVGSEVLGTVAAGVKVNDVFVFGPEAQASTVLTGREAGLTKRNTPVEVLLGFHVTLTDDFRAGSGIGAGLTQGDGSPSMRGVASFEYMPDYCVDPDGDGVCASIDACPNDAGPRSTDAKANGCPIDRDGDGFPDNEDGCPDERGVKTGDPLTSGCPDRDGDNVPDKTDACVDTAGVSTTTPATNGCPKSATPSP